MKQLKVKAVLKPDRRSFDLVITDQSHITWEFGGGQGLRSKNEELVFEHKGLILASNRFPMFCVGELPEWGVKSKVWVFVKGTTTSFGEYAEYPLSEFSADTIHNIHVSYFKRIKEAIAAYNEFYKEESNETPKGKSNRKAKG